MHTSTRKLPMGASSIEFLIVLLPMLLLLLGGIEFSLWYRHQQVSYHALVETARHASTTHAQSQEIIRAFEKSITPLFGGNVQHQQRFFNDVARRTQAPPWQIRLHSPSPAHFQDFASRHPDVRQLSTHAVISNHYQAQQNQSFGIGAVSQDRIFQANTLHVSLSMPYKPTLPGLGWVLRQAAGWHPEPFAQQQMRHGLLPVSLSLRLSMQSHPIYDPAANQTMHKVIYAQASPPGRAPTGLATAPNRVPQPGTSNAPNASAHHSNHHPTGNPSVSHTSLSTIPRGLFATPFQAPPRPIGNPFTLPSPPVAACGVTLCC